MPVTHAGSRPTRQEEVQARRDLAAGQVADAEHEDEIDRDQRVVECADVELQTLSAASRVVVVVINPFGGGRPSQCHRRT